jgi:hypothetical protein
MTAQFTITEAAEIITKEFPGCYATIEGRTIKVVYRGKKTDKITVYNGEISYTGGWQVAGVAGKIADRFNLIRNF